MQNIALSKKQSGIKYQLIKEALPVGTDVVHYIVPIEVNGRKTQEVPVSELENNPAKYASMFPQYIKPINLQQTATIKTVNAAYTVKSGVLSKKPVRRTVADIATPAEPVTRTATTEKKAAALPLPPLEESATPATKTRK